MWSWSIKIFWWLSVTHGLDITLTSSTSSSNEKCAAGRGIISPELAPKADIILEVGMPLEIYCSLELLNNTHVWKWNYTSKDIIFKTADHILENEHVTLVNSTTARLFSVNLPVSAKTKIFYCSLNLSGNGINNVSSNNTSNSSLGTSMINEPEPPSEQLLCSNSVLVGSKPKKVENFKCQSYNLQVLDCWWHEPNNGIQTNYSIYYSIPEESAEKSLVYGCPTDKNEPGHCRWTKNTSPSYRENFEYMNFYINGSNAFGNISQKFRWHHYTHIVVAKPSNLKILEKTTHSVQLQWDIGSWNLSNATIYYKVEYTNHTASKKGGTIYLTSETVENKNGHVQVNITDIAYPNMEYKFSVYMKLPKSDLRNPWSKAASVLVRTAPCAPYRSPETDQGGFEICGEYSNHRSVIVYWKQIPNEEHNGDNFRYTITVFENNIKVNIKPTSMTNVSAKFSNLSFNAYRFYIKSVNEIGPAPRSSIVSVPSKRDILREPFLLEKILFEGGVYELSVLSHYLDNDVDTRDIKIANFTLFWCDSNHGDPNPCTNLFSWTRLPIIKKYHNFACKVKLTTIPHIGYQFAVSTNTMSSSSGMKWILCTSIYKQANKIQHVWIETIGSSFAGLRWKLECANRVQGFLGYKILYCPVSENSQQECEESAEKYQEYYSDTNGYQVTIINLLPNTTYKMSVAILTGDKPLGPWSDWVYAHTQDGP